MKKYILLMSDVYLEEEFSSSPSLDLRDIQGTNCYCESGSAGILRKRLLQMGPEGIHWIDTGDYHYLTLLNLEKIREAFTLVLIDNHPDDQASAFDTPGVLSCGSWVREARQLPNLQSDIWIHDKAESVSSGEDDPGLPVYLSIDLDYLSPDAFRTNWNQGTESLDGLTRTLRGITGGRRVIGIDVCGGLTRSKGATDRDLEHNRKARLELERILTGF